MAAAANARKAKKKANQKLQKAKKQLNQAKKQSTKALNEAEWKGTEALQEGRDEGVQALEAGQAGAVGALTGAEAQAREDLTAGKDEGIGYIAEGRDDALGQYQNALDLYQPLSAAASQGAEKYGNFYGLGGQEGFDTAQSEFQASPLYQAMVGEGTLGQQALNRQAAARGNPYNAADTLQYQGQLAGKYVNDYTSGLRPYLDQQGQYAGAQANIYGNMANTIYGAGGQMGNMAYGAGQGLGNYAMNTGSNLSNVYTGTGQGIANAHLGTGSNISNLAQGIGTTQATGVNVPLAQTGANLTAQQGQNEAAMYANIQAAQNAQQANNSNMWGNILGAAGTLGGAALGNPALGKLL